MAQSGTYDKTCLGEGHGVDFGLWVFDPRFVQGLSHEVKDHRPVVDGRVFRQETLHTEEQHES